MTIEQPPQKAAIRFENLDALRGICALLVALFHFHSTGYLVQLPIVKNGWLFVDYFFVLSGFVIAHSYGERLGSDQVSLARFMSLRIGRIVPLHLAILAAFVALELALFLLPDVLGKFTSRQPFEDHRDIPLLIQNVAMLHSFGLGDKLSWNSPSWSIAAEMWTYFVFALVFIVRGRSLWPVAAMSIVAGAIIVTNWSSLSLTYDWGFLRCVFGFGIGVLTYHAWRRWDAKLSGHWEILAVLLVVGFVSLAENEVTFAAPFIFAVTIFVLAQQRGAVSRILNLSFLQFLGLISYSIYMVHMFVQARLGEVLAVTRLAAIDRRPDGSIILQAPPLVGDALTLMMLALVVIVSWLSYRIIEKPGQTFTKRWLAKRDAVRAAKGEVASGS